MKLKKAGCLCDHGTFPMSLQGYGVSHALTAFWLLLRRALEELAAKAAAEEAAEAEALAAKKAAEEAAAEEAAAEEAAEEAHRLQAEAEASNAADRGAVLTEGDTKDVRDMAAPQPAPGAKNKPQAAAHPQQRSTGLEPEAEDSLHGSSVDVQVQAASFLCCTCWSLLMSVVLTGRVAAPFLRSPAVSLHKAH